MAASSLDTVMIYGDSLKTVSAVSFGGTPAAYFVATSDTSIKAVVLKGASGAISITTAGGTITIPGFTFIQQTPPGNTLNFNGTDNYITIPRAVSGDFTIEYWVKTSQAGRNLTSQWYAGSGIVDGEMPGGANDFGTSLLGSKLCFGIGQLGGGDVSVISTSNVNTGRWVHVAAVRDSANGLIKLYINGVLEASAAAGKNSLTAPSTLSIGSILNQSGSTNFNGSIDELRFFTTNRSANIAADMLNTVDPNTPGLVAYYNFDEGVAGQPNTAITSLIDQGANNLTGTLNNFALTGNTSNWIESFAMVVPTNLTVSNINETGFTANWDATTIGAGAITSYLLDVTTDSTFTTFVAGYNALPVAGTSQVITGLTKGTSYYVRVRADKTSVTGQGAYIKGKANTYALPVINSFTPVTAIAGATVTISGSYFTDATAVSFGGVSTPFTVVNATTITATIGDGASGDVVVSAPGGIATKPGFTYIPPAGSLSFSPASAGMFDTVTIAGTDLATTSAVSFGGVPALSFSVTPDGSIKALVPNGVSGTISITTLAGTAVIPGFTYINSSTSLPGNALNFNGGNNYISVATGNTYVANNFTVEAWVRPLSKTQTMTILSTRNAAEYGFDIKLQNGNTIHSDVGYGTGWLNTGADGGYNYDSGKWFHVAFTVAPEGYTVYVNGNQVGSGYVFGPSLLMDGSHNLLTIGNNQNGEFFNGNIDEVKVWKSTRTREQIITDMFTAVSNPALDASLTAWYNFDEGTAGGSNTNINRLLDGSSNHFTGTLNGFALTGNSSNWMESYAMVQPTALDASNISAKEFTASWTAPSVGADVLANYVLDVAKDPGFTNFVTGDSALVVSGTSKLITGLVTGTNYWYRVRADKASVTGQGAYSNTIGLTTTGISSFSPQAAGAGITVTIHGNSLSGATAVSFGGSPAASFTVVDASTITAVVGQGATGYVSVTLPTEQDSMPGFTFLPAASITSFSPATASAFDTVIIKGTNLVTASAVSFGGTPALSFTVTSDTSITAVVAGGASGSIVITSLAGTATKNGFSYYTSATMPPPGNALNFTGNFADVSVPAGNVSVTGTYTVEAWVQPKGIRGQYTIINTGANALNLSTYFGSLLVSIGDGHEWIAGDAFVDYNITAGKWAHIALAVSPAGYKLYVNDSLAGEDVFSGNPTPVLFDNTHNIGIGTGTNYTNYFNGNIDELKIWNTVRTPAQVAADMLTVENNPAANTNLVAYYNFDEGVAGGSNNSTNLLIDHSANNLTGHLNYFGLNGATGNWVESYAMVVPVAIEPTNNTGSTFIANWTAPAVGTVDNYLLDVATDEGFGNIISGYNALPVSGTSQLIKGLSPLTNYYYRLRADKASVTSQGGYSNTKMVTTVAVGAPAITSFSPSSASLFDTIIIIGQNLYSVNAVSFGGTPAASFTATSDTSIIALVANGATGSISVTTMGGTITQNGFTYIAPAPMPPPGNALNFDGVNDHITINNPLSTDFTIEYWVKTTQTAGNGSSWYEGKGIVDGEIGGIANDLGTSLLGGKLYFGIGSPGTGQDVSIHSTSIINTGKWVHVAAVRNASTGQIKLFINGVAEDSAVADITPRAANSTLTLGAINTNNNYFEGAIDELRLFTTDRSSNIIADMNNSIDPATEGLATYYNFDEGDAGGVNTRFNLLIDQVANKPSIPLTGFALTGATSNWVESYAMVIPTINGATNITDSGFTAGWVAPAIGTVDNYLLDISTDSIFNNPVSGYNAKIVAGTSINATGLSRSGTYYYRVSANKVSASGQGSYSAINKVQLDGPPLISSFTPAVAATGATVVIKGFKLSGVTGIGFGGTPAASFSLIDDTTIAAIVGTGATGRVFIAYPGGLDSSANIFQYDAGPAVTSFNPATAGLLDTVTISGQGFTPTTAVSFGNTNAISFAVINDSTIKAIVGTGASGSASVTTPGGTSGLAGFTFAAKAPPGNALNFNGSSYVSVPVGSTSSSNNYTVEAWIKPQDPEDQNNQVSIINTDPNLFGRGFSLTLVQNYIELWLGTGSRTSAAADIPFNYTAGKWYHIACAVSANAYTVYVNGKAIYTDIIGRFPSVFTSFSNTVMTIGGDANSALHDDFYGNIDEVRVWKTTRTDAEINADMLNIVSNPANTDLLVYFNFDQGRAGELNALSPLYDMSANHLNGTLNGFGLSGSQSNWVESYAMVIPAPLAAINVTGTSFTAKWTAPVVGVADSYLLDVATDSTFSTLLPGYDSKTVNGTQQVVTGLTPATHYWYRVRADKASVTGQGNYIGYATAVTTNEVIVCASALPYLWNGIDYTTPGTYTVHLTNSAGGDSTATLVLTVSNGPAGTVSGAGGNTVTCFGQEKGLHITATGIQPLMYSIDGVNYQQRNNFAVLAGTYTVTIKDAGGCTAVTNSITITQPAAKLKVDDLQISGTQLTVTASGGFGGYMYSLNGSAYQPGAVFTRIPPGTENIMVKDANGCTAKGNIITLSATLAVENNNNTVCYGMKRKIQATAYRGTKPYQYSIDGGTTYQAGNAFNVKAGTYTVTVQDGGGSTFTTNSVTISQPADTLTIAANPVNATCANNDGSITINAAGGYGSYLYGLNDGSYDSSKIFSGLAAATYKATVIDSHGCIIKKNFIVKPPKTACGSLTGGDGPTSAAAEMHGDLTIKVMPNPAQVEFNLQVISGDSKSKVELRVMDMTGKVVYHTQGSVFDTYRFGRTFAGGMYIAEVMNGTNVERVKLVKGN